MEIDFPYLRMWTLSTSLFALCGRCWVKLAVQDKNVLPLGVRRSRIVFRQFSLILEGEKMKVMKMRVMKKGVSVLIRWRTIQKHSNWHWKKVSINKRQLSWTWGLFILLNWIMVRVCVFICFESLDKRSAILLSYYLEMLNGIIMEHGPFLGLFPRAGFYPSYLPTLMSNIEQHGMRYMSNGYTQKTKLSCA